MAPEGAWEAGTEPGACPRTRGSGVASHGASLPQVVSEATQQQHEVL